MNRRRSVPLLAVPLLMLLATPVLAQQSGGPNLGWNGWGVQVGLTSDPDQVYAGVHFHLGEFARNVRVRPTVEIGSGDDATLLQALFEVHYVFSKVQVWKPYVGGGAGFNYVKFDLPAGAQGDDTDTDVSLMGVGGVQTKLKSGTGFFFEGKVGLTDDDPDFKVGVGWSWK